MSCSHLFTGNFSPVLNRNRGTSSQRHRSVSRPTLFLRPPPTSFSVQGGLGSFTNLDFKFPIPPLGCGDNGGGYDGNRNGGGRGRGGGFGDSYNNGGGGDDIPFTDLGFILFLSCVLASLFFFTGYAHAIASIEDKSEGEKETVWEVKGSKWIQLNPDNFRDEFISATSSLPFSSFLTLDNFLSQCKILLSHFLLPEGFPNSVSSDYLDYSLWRGVQGIASQISGVLATQSLLYAVGLGKGAIPTAAAINWVLKDGIGYLGKIVLSKYGRHFDVHPKGWRLFADLLENAAFGLEMLTPVFPQFFVVIGATAGAGRSAASLIQAATRSCFYAGFAARRNFAEVIAKGEAQGMVSKAVGIMLGIGLANCIGTSTNLMLASFIVVTCIHMYTNLKSYQCIQLRTLNPYRASLVFSEYLRSGQAPSIKDVNDEEPLFPDVPNLNIKSINKMQSISLSSEARDAAADIEQRLQLGSKLSDVVNNKEDAFALFNLYKDEGYILTEHKGKFCVVLKESSTPQDMLKSLFQVNYLYWLEKNVGIEPGSLFIDCKPGGRLHISLDYVQRELDIVKTDSQSVGWLTDGLIARPLPTRIRPCFISSSTTS